MRPEISRELIDRIDEQQRENDDFKLSLMLDSVFPPSASEPQLGDGWVDGELEAVKTVSLTDVKQELVDRDVKNGPMFYSRVAIIIAGEYEFRGKNRLPNGVPIYQTSLIKELL